MKLSKIEVECIVCGTKGHMSMKLWTNGDNTFKLPGGWLARGRSWSNGYDEGDTDVDTNADFQIVCSKKCSQKT